MKIYFATSNPHKLDEVKKMIRISLYDMQPMSELGFDGEIPETGSTLKQNALIKARFIHDKYGVNVFSEDTGLEVNALDGAPGTQTARFAGEDKNSENNMNLLINMLEDKDDREAKFRTVIALIMNGEEKIFEGFVNGKIAKEKRGKGGFGYDPVFIPNGYAKTYAELHYDIKNGTSHRYRAFTKMVEYLKITSKSLV